MNEPHDLRQEPLRGRPGRRVIPLMLSLILGLVFIVSGVSKLFTMEALEWAIMDLGLPWLSLAGLGARLLIGLELVLGGFLIFQIALKRFTLPLTIALLTVFLVYLGVLYGIQGGQESCGCFGDWIRLKPWQSLIKNLIMIGIAGYLLRVYRPRPYRLAPVLGLLIVLGGTATPFGVDPYFWDRSVQVISEPVDLSPLYAGESRPDQELRVGKHVLAFLSLNCVHCQKAAFRLQALYRQNPSWPVYFILLGPEEGLDPFFALTHSGHVPHYLMKDLDAFLDLAGPAVPAIYWIRDGVKERKSHYGQLDPQEIQQWLTKTEE